MSTPPAWSLQCIRVPAAGNRYYQLQQRSLAKGMDQLTDHRTDSNTRDPAGSRATAVALKASEARFRTLFEHSQIGVVLADAGSHYIDANPSACRMLGYTRDELTGLHASDILVASEAPHVDTALRELHEKLDHRREWRFRRKDGSEFLADVVATGLPDGTLLGLIHDLTAEKQALQHEREIARLLQLNSALHQISQAIASTHERDHLFRKVCRVLIEHGGLRMAWVGWHDPATHRLDPIAEFGDEKGYLDNVTIYTDGREESQGPTGTAFRTGQPVINNDMLGNSTTLIWRSEVERCGYQSSAALPIRENGEVCAVLSVYADRMDFFRDKEVALLEEAASDLSYALDTFRKEYERRVAEDTIRNEKQFSDAMLESMPGIFYFYDAEGHFLRWNRNFETVSGYSREQISRMHPREFFPEEERAYVEERIAEVFEKGESSVEATFVSQDGTATPHFFTGRRITYNGETCLVGVGIDIAERKRAEARLRESQSHLNDAQRIAGIGSWSYDIRSGRRGWSDQMFAIFGIAKSEFDGLDDTLFEFVHPDDLDRLVTAREMAITGRQRLDIEYRLVRRDGTERVVHELADLHTNDNGEPISLAGTMHDITDRARIQAEREKRHRAEAADRIKSAFLATMSHELRTPLNSIVGFTGILLQELAGPLNPEQGKQLEMVQASARHLLALVNDVLDISKIEAGQFEVASEPFDLRQSIDRMLAQIKPQADKKQLEVHADIARELGGAIGDQRRFEQVLLNLLSNAVKFTHHGEIRLVAEKLADIMLPGAQSGQPAIRLDVRDSGIGIKPHDLATLFQPFRQVDGGLSRQHEGTGLGLAICQRLTELMGGEITASSEFGKGSTFSVILPLGGRVIE